MSAVDIPFTLLFNSDPADENEKYLSVPSILVVQDFSHCIEICFLFDRGLILKMREEMKEELDAVRALI